jgi:hypothetical protein
VNDVFVTFVLWKGAHSTSSLPIDQAKVGMSSAILLLFGIDGPFCSGHFNPPFKKFFSTMDLDNDYYSSRCKES